MSVTIKLYTYNRESTRVLKTGSLSLYATLTGNFRESTDIMNPSFVIEYSGYPAANYAYIQDLNRYYFISSIVSERLNVWRLNLHEDVLYTFAGDKTAGTGIYGLTAYIDRYAGTTDRNLIDTAYPLLANATRKRFTGTSGTSWYGSNSFLINDSADLIYRYMMLFNGFVMQGAIQVTPMYLISDMITNQRGLYNLAADLNGMFVFGTTTPAEYIQSIRCYPVALPKRADITNIDGITFPGIATAIALDTVNGDYHVTSEKYIDVTWTVNVTAPSSVNLFKNYQPYSNISLTFLPFGRFALDNSIVFASGNATVPVYVRCHLDVLSGNAVLYYGMTSAAANIYLGQANVTIECPITSSAYSLSRIAGGTLSAIGGVASMAAGVPTGVIGAATGVLTLASSFDVASSTTNAGNVKIIDDAPVIDVQTHDIVDTAVNLIGRPHCMTDMLKNLSGYTKIGRVHVENLTMPATENEKQEIEALLLNGVIL